MDDYGSALTVEDDYPTQPVGPTDSMPSSGDFSPLAQYYGYDSPTDYEREKLGFVWQYFNEYSDGPGRTMEELRNLERTLARPELGQTRLDRLYSYLRLVRASQDQNAELRAYLR